MEVEDIRAFGKDLYTNHISLKQLDIPSIKINYWKRKLILPFFESSNYQKHAKLNIPQALWLLIINELSDIGIKTDKLAELSKAVWNQPRVEKYADEVIKWNISRKKNPLPESERLILADMLKDELLMDTLRTELIPFTDTIKCCVWSENKIPNSLIYIPKTGEHAFITHDSELNLKLTTKYLEHALINIPLNPLLTKILEFDITNNQEKLNYLTEIENQIRDIVIFRKPKYIEIVTDEEGIKPFIITEQHKTGEELAKFFLNNSIPKNAKLLIHVRAQGNYKITLIKK